MSITTISRSFLSLSLSKLSILTFRQLSSLERSFSSHSPIPNYLSSLLNSHKPLKAAAFILRSPPNPSIPPELYNSLLASLSSDGHSYPARHLFDTMLHREIPFSDTGFSCFIKKFSGSEGLDKTLSIVEKVNAKSNQINGSVAAAVIVDGLCRAGKIEDAWTALTELRLLGWKPDFMAYRIVSEGFRIAGRFEEERRILNQKRKLGVAPRKKDYGDFVLSLVAERRIQDAKELGEAIVYGDFPMDDIVAESLIASLSDVDADSAVSLLKYVVLKQRFPSLSMLRHFCGNLCKNGKGDEMWDVFNLLSDNGYFTELEGYRLMVYFLCKVGKLREAYEVLKEMKKIGLGPDIYSYNSLMEACCRDDLLRPAKKLWDEMFTNGCCANLVTYNTLISKLSEEGELEEAQRLFHNMMGKGIAPDISTYKPLIKFLCQEKNFDGAQEIFNKSVDQDFILAELTLSTLIHSLCKEGKYVIASTIMYGLPSDVESSDSHVILLKSLTDAGEANLAINHIEWVRKNSPYKLQTVLTKLFASLSTAPKLEPVLQLLQLMHLKGFLSKDDPWIQLLEGDLSLTDSCT